MGSRRPTDRASRGLARAHGVFNLAFGAWPFLHRRSFEAVSGPKVDWWLVETVGGLLVVNGLVQYAAPATRDGQAAARRLGIGTALVLAAVDVTYVARGRISRVYLVDAACEVLWAAAWARRRLAS